MNIKQKRIRIVHIDPFRCIGCTVCVQSCMNDVLRMKRGKAFIAYGEDCCHCMSCEFDCPRDAVAFGWVQK